MKKLKLHFQCPQNRGWNGGGADKTKHGLYFIFHTGHFLYTISSATEGSPFLSTNVFFPFVCSK